MAFAVSATTTGQRALLFAQAGGGLDPVQARHLDNHQHKVMVLRCAGLDRLAPVLGQIWGIAQTGQYLDPQLAVHRIVIDRQDGQRLAPGKARIKVPHMFGRRGGGLSGCHQGEKGSPQDQGFDRLGQQVGPPQTPQPFPVGGGERPMKL